MRVVALLVATACLVAPGAARAAAPTRRLEIAPSVGVVHGMCRGERPCLFGVGATAGVAGRYRLASNLQAGVSAAAALLDVPSSEATPDGTGYLVGATSSSGRALDLLAIASFVPFTLGRLEPRLELGIGAAYAAIVADRTFSAEGPNLSETTVAGTATASRTGLYAPLSLGAGYMAREGLRLGVLATYLAGLLTRPCFDIDVRPMVTPCGTLDADRVAPAGLIRVTLEVAIQLGPPSDEGGAPRPVEHPPAPPHAPVRDPRLRSAR